MQVNGQTKIKELLQHNPEEVIEALIKLNKNFSKLKNPLLRKLFAGRVSIADACGIAGCEVDAFLNSMAQVGFQIGQPKPFATDIPAALRKDQLNPEVIELDVRPMLAQNKDPLKMILQQADKLEKNQVLKLINTFEPVPLIHVLAERGFAHFTESEVPDKIITWFQKNKDSGKSVRTVSITPEKEKDFDELLKQFQDEKLIRIDVRALPMPQPMLLILEKTSDLTSGEALFVYHKKVPVYLLPQLVERGFEYAFKEIENGEVYLIIYKP